jgi:DnaJ family protein B protein 12
MHYYTILTNAERQGQMMPLKVLNGIIIAISHAWTVLGVIDKKDHYDRFGVDSEASGNRSPNPFQGFQGFGGQQGFEGQISPEELLRMFMGGGAGFQAGGFNFQAGPGFGGPRFRTRRTRREPEREEVQGTAAVILQFLPVILLFFISAFSLFAAEDDPFSFQRNYEYSLDKETKRHNVKYYVNPRTFSKRFGTVRKLSELEQRVEQDVRIGLTF